MNYKAILEHPNTFRTNNKNKLQTYYRLYPKYPQNTFSQRSEQPPSTPLKYPPAHPHHPMGTHTARGMN